MHRNKKSEEMEYNINAQHVTTQKHQQLPQGRGEGIIIQHLKTTSRAKREMYKMQTTPQE